MTWAVEFWFSCAARHRNNNVDGQTIEGMVSVCCYSVGVVETAVVVVQTYERKRTSPAVNEFTELREEYREARRSGGNCRRNGR